MPAIKRSSTYMTPGGAGSKSRKRRKLTKWTVSSAPVLAKNHNLLATKQSFTTRYVAQRPLLGGVPGAAGVHVFSCNGLFDPDITGIGHQPRGFDQVMSLYDHYLVKKATCEVWVKNTSTAPSMIAIQVKDTNTTSVNVIDVAEDEYSTMMAADGANGSASGYVRFSVDVQKYLGGKDLSEQKGSAGANPNEGVFFHVIGFPVDPTNTVNMDALVKITYQADLLEPKQPVSS